MNEENSIWKHSFKESDVFWLPLLSADGLLLKKRKLFFLLKNLLFELRQTAKF
jgi:hypothetical protein